ncbi:hypothetical protein YTPLAS18_23480 [Nitrospira sp.]|nr:hypothetical protein YTPLAS18_23480 [Nitrospira sp.]
MGKRTNSSRSTTHSSVRDPRLGVITATRRRGPSRAAKANLRERIVQDTATMRRSTLLVMLKSQGYEEVPLEELQDRLSKLPDELGPVMVAGRK